MATGCPMMKMQRQTDLAFDLQIIQATEKYDEFATQATQLSVPALTARPGPMNWLCWISQRRSITRSRL